MIVKVTYRQYKSNILLYMYHTYTEPNSCCDQFSRLSNSQNKFSHIYFATCRGKMHSPVGDAIAKHTQHTSMTTRTRIQYVFRDIFNERINARPRSTKMLLARLILYVYNVMPNPVVKQPFDVTPISTIRQADTIQRP